LKRTFSSVFVFLVLLSAVVVPAAERTAETVATGLRHLVISKGEVATAKSYRILIGEFESQVEADQQLERLQKIGITAFPVSFGDDYYVVTPGLPHRTDAEALRQQLIERGIPPPLEIEETSHDITHANGPWRIHVLEADQKKIDVRVAHAYDAAIGLETTADLALRRGALAAINGGYYYMKGLFAGDSRGALEIDDRLLSEPDRGRASVGFFVQDGATKSVFGRLGFRGKLRLADGELISFDGLNRKRVPAEIVLFTPEFHRTTLTPSDGTEVVIQNGRITEIRSDSGSSLIPSSGMVLSIGGERVEEVLPRMQLGGRVSVEMTLVPLLPDPEGEWDKAEHIVSGGPLLLWRGNPLEEPQVESISRVFFLARHPRTAVGVRADGTLLFVTVDGRRPEESVGMSLPELTDLMLGLGAVSAINLDGGGSTSMVIDGEVVNRPSGGEARRNADAILLYPRKP
jgi:hypothetical protein